ncbi:MAG: EAL domain-containing protein [Candidatus Thiodiazotropha sp.]
MPRSAESPNNRQRAYLLIGGGLFVSFYLTRTLHWEGSKDLHTLMEVIATLLAFFVGTLGLVRYYTKPNNTILLIGAAFLGTACLDGYHAVVTSQWFDQLWPSPPPQLIPWSWNASRTYLALMMVLSWLAWRSERRMGEKGALSPVIIYLAVGALTLASFTFFAIAPLPRAYYPELIFGRPEEFVSAALFLVALMGYLHKGAWRHDSLEHWLVISLIVGFVCQAAFMSSSFHLYDAMFDTAHLLKKVSYLCVLTGLLVSLMSVLIQAEQDKVALVNSEKRYRSILDNASDAIFITDRNQKFTFVNQKAGELLGYSRDDLLNAEIMDVTPREDIGNAMRAFERVLRDGQERNELILKHRDNSRVAVELNAIRLPDGTVYGACRDIRQRKRSEQRLQLAASVFSHALEGIAILDIQGSVVDVNRAFVAITGYSAEEAKGRSLQSLKNSEGGSQAFDRIWSDLRQHGHWFGELWSRTKDGISYAETLTISEVQDETGGILHYVALFSDVTSQKKHQLELEHIAHHDALTDLPNRVLLADRLSQAMHQAVRRENLLAVAYMDLDGFKTINDDYGHETGDAFLLAISRRITQHLRKGDTCARLGGDEFIIVLVDLADTEACQPLLKRLLEAVSEPLEVDAVSLSVTASVGVSFYPQEESVDADRLLRQADQAMYQVKMEGKNRIHYFDAGMDRYIRVQQETCERVRGGISADEFRVFYQPKIALRKRDVIGFEALLRWQHPDKGLLPPGDFLPLISGHPVSGELDLWVMQTVLHQLQVWKASGIRLPISVNLGAELIQRSDFVSILSRLVRAHPQLDHGFLELEILETRALKNIDQVTGVMEACHEMGIGFALDDFGTGYSSLTYLRRLPARVLKIDQSFIRGMHRNPEDLLIVDGIVGLAGAFHRQVIAEGVETQIQAEMLLRHGCEFAQGYLFAKPMPAGTCAEWLMKWQAEMALAPQPASEID